MCKWYKVPPGSMFGKNTKNVYSDWKIMAVWSTVSEHSRYPIEWYITIPGCDITHAISYYNVLNVCPSIPNVKLIIRTSYENRIIQTSDGREIIKCCKQLRMVEYALQQRDIKILDILQFTRNQVDGTNSSVVMKW